MIVAFALGMSDEATRLNALTEQIIGASIEVHRVLGPGLLESAYEACRGVRRRVNGFPE